MGVIGKDFKFKIIKNFLTKSEVKLLNKYCEIKHRTNLGSQPVGDGTFDTACKNMDTRFYGDPIMEALSLEKQNLMEKETGKKLLGTYSYWRMYTKFADLKTHTDRPACEISVTVHIGGDIGWPIFIDGKECVTEPGNAVIYLGMDLKHGRKEFLGDWQAQCFIHYVDANGPHTDNFMDQRPYWGMRSSKKEVIRLKE